MKNITKIIALLLIACFAFTSCSSLANVETDNGDLYAAEETSDASSQSSNNIENLSEEAENELLPAPETYNEGVVLVKCDEEEKLNEYSFASTNQLYGGSAWYLCELAEGEDTAETVEYLRTLDVFDEVDFDYIMGVGAEVESVDISGNPDHGKQNDTFKTHHIKEGWDYLKKNGYNPGGSSDVVVAVIDTGVDYSHLDLRNNIWVNSAEIPDNGKDDDGNGYIDDLCGWNFVADNKDPMDDNGHGTHVAGIIAAENNKEGGVGVAYNCKVMVLKAGNSSGYFNNSDIAEAIQYAYMNGADVINMSFGGSSISLAVEEALENAYNTSILVAAAGNDSDCNNLACKVCLNKKVSYPAALPYVIGVMSTKKDGKEISLFSNYDHYPHNSIEYEVYAVGEGVYSTWPNNKYATLNGTSMAAPMVSGIAALLRSYYSDRETFSTKFIQSQIINTGDVNVDGAHLLANLHNALTKSPTPDVNLYDYYIDDSTSISANNNANGAIDAGETIRIYFSLHNRGGVASNVCVSIDTLAMNDPFLTDPYFTFVNPTMQLSDIGTYSVRESGEEYFEIIVDSECPNDYTVDFYIRYTYENGMDKNDKNIYSDDGDQKIQANVCNGIYLPVVIDEDMTLYSNRLYLIQNDVLVRPNVTVTVEPGVRIEFLSGTMQVKGDLYCNGTAENMIVIENGYIGGGTSYLYTKFDYHRFISGTTFDHCIGYGGGSISGGSVSNSKFVDVSSVLADYIDHCQFVSTDVENLHLGNIKNSVYISELTYIGVTYREMAITLSDLDSITKLVKTDDKTYVAINCKFNYRSGYPADFKEELEYECALLSSHFSGKMAVLSSTQKNELGISGLCYSIDNSFEGVSRYTEACTILFEIDGIEIEKEDIWQAYTKYNDTAETMRGFDNVAVLGKNTSIIAKDSYNYGENYSLDYSDLKYRWNLSNIYLGTANQNDIEDMIRNYATYGKYCMVVPEGYLTTANEDMWPMVSDAYILNKDGERISTIGNDTVQFVVEFNRDMNTSIPLTLTFGTIHPYVDYKVEGEWITPRQWIGEYTLKSSIENGEQYIMISNAQLAEDAFFTAEDKTGRFTFTIDTTAAMSMNLQANPTENGIELNFVQDDYDTLLGYNVYRSTEKDGNYVKLNPAILLPDELTFLDENAEPGKTYWYTYTVVLTDFTESNPAGKVQATAMDTMAPSLYHTPVNQGYMNNNLVITCTASDNVGIQSVILYYRAVGASEWKTLEMGKQSDKFSAKIYGNELTLDGIEYYIVAYDELNSIAKGSAEAPYTVVIKDASAISRKGDVDGDSVVTTKDALMLMQCINGDLILSDDEFKRADLNGDEVLNSSEALRILQYINGKVNTLEM